MKTELKNQWVAALRSGEFKQGRGQLEKDGKFCCLGVLREISPSVKMFGATDDGMLLAPMALNWAYLTSENQNLLAEMNDGSHDGAGGYCGMPKSFKQIATYIEKHL